MTLSPTGWAYEIVSGGDAERTPEGLVPHEVRFWDTAARQRDGLGKHRITAVDGDRASDLMNSFLMQIRENHQRIVTREDSYLLHSDQSRGNIWVPPEVVMDIDALGAFLKARDLPLGGYEPFLFPNYAGVEEPLDGMWQRELHTVPLLGQVEANIERYITVAKREGWDGDRRGTTLNLQIGTSSDDAIEDVTFNSVFIIDPTVIFGNLVGTLWHDGLRFTGISGLAGATIDGAVLTFEPTATDAGLFIGDWFAEDAAAPPTFAGVPNSISDRPRTAATQEGDSSDFGAWTNGVTVTFEGDATGIAGIIQELANSYDPSSIVLIHIFTSGTGERLADSYDGSTINAPKLDITFTAAEPLVVPAGQFLPSGWGGPAAPPEGTGPPGGAVSGAPTGTAPGYGDIGSAVRARQLADAVCDGVTVAARGQQSVTFSLAQLLHCLQGKPPPRAPQSAEASLNAIFVELGITRRTNVTFAQELDIIAAHLP